jgi:hypothetical protein
MVEQVVHQHLKQQVGVVAVLVALVVMDQTLQVAAVQAVLVQQIV